ncbi:MAG: tRNA lysidine(34) synthetase TilS [Desulfococcus sp. 4484_242]|nr:MAG: tRNA lysidine(34) synthetase TilS [Desulfococcus sp. 4484_242]
MSYQALSNFQCLAFFKGVRRIDPVRLVEKKVKRAVARYCMIAPGDRVVAAVSGGADSVCLLDVLDRLRNTLRITLIVAHLDHGLRPDVDEQETAFVRDLAASRGLDFAFKRVNPPMDPKGPSLEEKARELRYRFLKKVQAGWGAQRIATGHSLDDQAETVLMRLLRGSGPAGLSGIPPVRKDGIVRPLIEITREEIRSYLDHMGLAHVTDASNFDVTYLRNAIRRHLLPQLETYQPRIKEILGRTAEIAREDNRYLTGRAEAWLSEKAEMGSEGPVLPVSGLMGLPPSLQNHAVRAALKIMTGSLRRIGVAHINAVRGLVMGSRPQAGITLPQGLVVRRVYDRLYFSRGPSAPRNDYAVVIEGPGTWHIDALGCDICLEEAPAGPSIQGLEAGGWIACLDAERIAFPLTLRSVQPGDRFVPLGMKGHKKLKDFFVDRKIPSRVRSRIPILAQGNRVVWVCGLRIDDRFKVGPRTKRILKISFEGAGPVPE